MKYLNIIIILFIAITLSSCYKNAKNIQNNIFEENISNKNNDIIVYSNELLWEELKNLANLINIDFSLYPTINIWEKIECVPFLDTELKLNYQSIIINESKLEPNFDGKYRIVNFGYGTNAQFFFIIDLNNGNVYEGKTSSFGIKYELNSSMIIINPIENMFWDNGMSVPKWANIEYIRWNGQEFIGLIILNG